MSQRDDAEDSAAAHGHSPISAAEGASRQPEADPDDDVLALIDRGDMHGAILRLMGRHGVAIYRFCCDALHDAVLAEDVHQQTFVQAFCDLAAFRRRSTVRAWLFGIARHRALDAAKQRHRTRSRIEEADPAELADFSVPPEGALDDAQLQAELIACVRELDEDVRIALLLRYQHGFSFEEMAVVCAEKPGTLRARVARALPVLRARIERRQARAGRAASRV